MDGPRMTTQTLAVLAVMLGEPTAEWYGFDLADRAGLKTGTLYPILVRLEHAKWLHSYWETVDPHVVGRPRRRLYELTAEGQQAAQAELHRHVGQMTRPAARVGARPHGQPA